MLLYFWNHINFITQFSYLALMQSWKIRPEFSFILPFLNLGLIKQKMTNKNLSSKTKQQFIIKKIEFCWVIKSIWWYAMFKILHIYPHTKNCKMLESKLIDILMFCCSVGTFVILRTLLTYFSPHFSTVFTFF